MTRRRDTHSTVTAAGPSRFRGRTIPRFTRGRARCAAPAAARRTHR